MSRSPRRYLAVGSATLLLTLGASLGAGASVSTRASAPLAVHARTAASAVRVSWSAPRVRGGSSIVEYVVRSEPGGHGCYTRALSCSVIGLTKGATYTFTVTAKNRTGMGVVSGPSNSVTVVAENGTPVSSVASFG